MLLGMLLLLGLVCGFFFFFSFFFVFFFVFFCIFFFLFCIFVFCFLKCSSRSLYFVSFSNFKKIILIGEIDQKIIEQLYKSPEIYDFVYVANVTNLIENLIPEEMEFVLGQLISLGRQVLFCVFFVCFFLCVFFFVCVFLCVFFFWFYFILIFSFYY